MVWLAVNEAGRSALCVDSQVHICVSDAVTVKTTL